MRLIWRSDRERILRRWQDSGCTASASLTEIAPYAVQTFSITGGNQSAVVRCSLQITDNRDAELMPGTTVDVKLFTDTIENAVTVPYTAIRQDDPAVCVRVRARWNHSQKRYRDRIPAQPGRTGYLGCICRRMDRVIIRPHCRTERRCTRMRGSDLIRLAFGQVKRGGVRSLLCGCTVAIGVCAISVIGAVGDVAQDGDARGHSCNRPAWYDLLFRGCTVRGGSDTGVCRSGDGIVL